MADHLSWGRHQHVTQKARRINARTETLAGSNGKTILPYGAGRSYGDSCLNDGGEILVTDQLSHFISFNAETGILRAEAGVLLGDILRAIVKRGWFLPVTPGTKYVTLGGAIANDVHGKNHHKAGTFGCFVRAFELLRSDGERVVCTKDENPELFSATIGGLGLTGLVVWADIQLKKIESTYIDVESIQFGSLDQFFDLTAASDARYEYTVAWLDCLAMGNQFGRGIFMRGNHSHVRKELTPHRSPFLSVPLDFPQWVLNRWSVKAFNAVYFHKQFEKNERKTTHYDPFFYPLDSIVNWNRIYGKRGFFQFQCVVPKDEARVSVSDLVRRVAKIGQASFLSVIKEFGSIQSPGMLSFPRPGITLCMDLANRGEETIQFLRELDKVAYEAGGAVYPAKDAVMAGAHFQKYFPRWEEFQKYIDPAFSSSFWRRVTDKEEQQKSI